jgi:hypothetical protein
VRIQARAWCDLKTELKGSRIAGFSAGPDQRIYVLVCLGEADESRTDRRVATDWRVIVVGAHERSEYLIPNQLLNFNFVQPMPDGLLLATSRCEYSAALCKPNGQIFGLDGVRQSAVMLGDGIQHLQTTKSGEIWVAYFDEGVFGNRGWRQPIGAKGLLRFNADGDRVYEFEPTSGLDDIVDCYALNVVGNSEVWCYYYTQFPLVKIVNERVEQYWECPISGSSAFAVWRDSVLMRGGYDQDQDWSLMTLLPAGKLRVEWTGRIEDDFGYLNKADRWFTTTRGSNLWYLRDGILFNVDVKDLGN